MVRRRERDGVGGRTTGAGWSRREEEGSRREQEGGGREQEGAGGRREGAGGGRREEGGSRREQEGGGREQEGAEGRTEEHTSELKSDSDLVCGHLLEKKNEIGAQKKDKQEKA